MADHQGEREVRNGTREAGAVTALDLGAYPDLAALRHDYDVPLGEEVAELIARHPRIGVLLVEARGEIEAAFGHATPVRLEVATDPEEGDAVLFARVLTRLPPVEALGRLNALWEAWGLDAMAQADGFFQIDVQAA